MRVYHLATAEWMTSEELQSRLDKGFNFKCNECHKEIGYNVKVLAEGIFCLNCFTKITGDLESA